MNKSAPVCRLRGGRAILSAVNRASEKTVYRLDLGNNAAAASMYSAGH